MSMSTLNINLNLKIKLKIKVNHKDYREDILKWHFLKQILPIVQFLCEYLAFKRAYTTKNMV